MIYEQIKELIEVAKKRSYRKMYKLYQRSSSGSKYSY